MGQDHADETGASRPARTTDGGSGTTTAPEATGPAAPGDDPGTPEDPAPAAADQDPAGAEPADAALDMAPADAASAEEAPADGEQATDAPAGAAHPGDEPPTVALTKDGPGTGSAPDTDHDGTGDAEETPAPAEDGTPPATDDGPPPVLSTETPGPLVPPARDAGAAAPDTPSGDRPGTEESASADRGRETGRDLLSGRYRLDSVVGRGGMGTVWRATDTMLGRTVAVKELRLPSTLEDAERQLLVTRTLREAKAIATIRSRGVVTIYDVIDDGTRPWIVMELIEGRALSDIVYRDGTLDEDHAARIGLDVLEVLAAAHRCGIVHRDVKPSNVLIAHDDGRVVLTDFGIAKVEGDSSITSTGMLVGAPSYISPERAWGGGLSPAADLWSLGALLYCAVVGRAPHDQGGAIATLTAVMNDPVDLPADLGPLSGVIEGLLRKDPAQRYDERTTRRLLRAVVDGTADEAAEGSGADDTSDSSTTVVLGPASSGATAATPRTPIQPPTESAGQAAAGTTEQPPGAEAAEESGVDATPARPVPVPGGEFGPATPAGGHPPVGDTLRGDSGVGSDGPAGGRNRRTRLLLLVALGVAVLALVAALVVPRLVAGDDEPAPDPTGEPTEEPTDDPPAEDGGDDADGEDEPEPTETEDDIPEEDPDGTGPPGATPDRDPEAPLPESPDGFSRQLDGAQRFGADQPAED